MNKTLFVIMGSLPFMIGCAGTIEGVRADWNTFLIDNQEVITNIETAVELLKEVNDTAAK